MMTKQNEATVSLDNHVKSRNSNNPMQVDRDRGNPAEQQTIPISNSSTPIPTMVADIHSPSHKNESKDYHSYSAMDVVLEVCTEEESLVTLHNKDLKQQQSYVRKNQKRIPIALQTNATATETAATTFTATAISAPATLSVRSPTTHLSSATYIV